MLRVVLTDARIGVLSALLGLVLLACRWWLPAETGFRFVVGSGYWFMLALVVLFGRAVGPLLAEAWRSLRPGRFECGVALVIAAFSVTWWAHEDRGFKILADEVLLLGSSMGMHYERTAAYPTRATDVQGPFQILHRVLDKRPLLFPFLAATVHDLTGYRPENPFYLNMGLGVIFLISVYVLGWLAAHERWAGVLLVILFGGLPLLAQQSTGGGFDLLNLLLLTGLTLAMIGYLRQPDVRRLEALVFLALMLASTRYESVLFLVPAAGAVVWGWWRVRRVVLSWPVVLSPVFLIPTLIQNRIFAGGSGAWEMESVGATTPFGLDYLSGNLGHALAFFFDGSGYQPNSMLFAAAGLIALPFFLLWIVRILRTPERQNPQTIAVSLGGLGLGAVTLLYLLYFWGQFDHPLIRRLSLPVHLLMGLAIVVTAAQFFRGRRAWVSAAAIAGGGLIVQGLPTLAKQAYTASYTPGVETAMRREFLAGVAEQNPLFIDNDSVFWITHHVPATPANQAEARREGIAYHLRNHSFSDIFVFQSVLVDPETGRRTIDPADELGPNYELEVVWEKRVQALLFARISRVTAIRDDGEVVARAGAFIQPHPPALTAEQLTEARAAYLETWIKNLP